MTADQELVRKLRAGDQAALRSLYERYKDDLLTVAGWLLVDAASGEDVLHDVFVEFAANAAQVRPNGSLRTYLVASVANRARDELRKPRRRSLPLHELDDPVSPLTGPMQGVADSERPVRLHAALAELPYEVR